MNIFMILATILFLAYGQIYAADEYGDKTTNITGYMAQLEPVRCQFLELMQKDKLMAYEQFLNYVAQGNVALMEMGFDAGVPVYVKSATTGLSAIEISACRGDMETVQALIKRGALYQSNKIIKNACILALNCGFDELAEFILNEKSKFDLNESTCIWIKGGMVWSD
jgi:hypothetical protein